METFQFNMEKFHALAFSFVGISILTIFAMIYFVWALLRGKIDLTSSTYDEEMRKFQSPDKADLNELGDPTVWLPEFAKETNVDVHMRGRRGFSHVWIEVNNKSKEQIAEEKRVYFEAKEKKP